MAHIADYPVPTESEIAAMAVVLARRYGAKANDVARHFVLEHEAIGDHTRAEIWGKVRDCLPRNRAKPTLS